MVGVGVVAMCGGNGVLRAHVCWDGWVSAWYGATAIARAALGNVHVCTLCARVLGVWTCGVDVV